MMPENLATLGFPVLEVTNKILSRESNCIVDVVM